MKMEKQKKNKSNEFFLAVVAIFEKILGFAKNLIFSFYFGASSISDAFNITLTIPDTLFSMLGNAVGAGYIPIATSNENRGSLNKITSYYLKIVVFLLGGICFLCVPIFDIIVKVFAPGFDSSTTQLTVILLRIAIASIVFNGASCILTSFLQIKGRFLSSGVCTLVLNILLCIFSVIAAKYGYYYLGIGILLGSIFQFFLLLVLSIRNDWKYIGGFPDYNLLKQIIMFAVPIMLGASVNRVNVIVDKAIASTVAIGGISSLTYADNIILFLKAIFATPIITVIFPLISKKISTHKIEASKAFSESMEKMVFYLVPVTIGGYILSRQIVSIIYFRGAFDMDALSVTTSCFQLYIIGLIAFSFRDLFVKISYAKNDSKTPMINMTVGVVINIGLNLLFSRFMGVKGLALATSISSYITMLLMYRSIRDDVEMSIVKTSFKKIVLIGIAGCIMGVATFTTHHFLELATINSILVFSICIVVSVFVYVLCLLLLRVYDRRTLVNRILMR